ncbi:MAG: VTT domain-containing protein [Verrucomicrobiae bacterium]|nr:VTT domain-containing protein [Verrucomicrobiae bacterium]
MPSSLRPTDFRRKWFAGILLVIGAEAFLSLFGSDFNLDRETIIQNGKNLPDAAFLFLFGVLPVIGAPISPFLVIAGLKYGTVSGMLVATAATAVHNAVTYFLAETCLKKRIESLLARLGYAIPTIPSQHQWWFTAVFAVVPGLPYTIKLYSLALTNIGFRTFFWIGWPMYAASSIVYVVLGDAAASMSVGWFIVVTALSILLIWIAHRAVRKFQRAKSGFPDLAK